MNRIDKLKSELEAESLIKTLEVPKRSSSRSSETPSDTKAVTELSATKEEADLAENLDTRSSVDSNSTIEKDDPKELQDKLDPSPNESSTIKAIVPYNAKIKLFLIESVNSEQPRSSGDKIEIRVKENIYDGTNLLFNSYGKVRAHLKNFKSSLNNKKGLIELVVDQVQAYDGSWIDVHRSTFRIPGKRGERINISKDIDLEVFTSESKIITYKINQ